MAISISVIVYTSNRDANGFSLLETVLRKFMDPHPKKRS